MFLRCVCILPLEIYIGGLCDHVCKWVNNSLKMTVRINNLTGHLQRAEQKTKAENGNLPSQGNPQGHINALYFFLLF